MIRFQPPDKNAHIFKKATVWLFLLGILFLSSGVSLAALFVISMLVTVVISGTGGSLHLDITGAHFLIQFFAYSVPGLWLILKADTHSNMPLLIMILTLGLSSFFWTFLAIEF